jgi:xylose isomerase
MELYLSPWEKARAFRADPEVQEALQAARVPDLAQPTLGAGETHNELQQDRSAFEDFAIDRARTEGYGFARLQRLAIEHPLGTADPSTRCRRPPAPIPRRRPPRSFSASSANATAA